MGGAFRGVKSAPERSGCPSYLWNPPPHPLRLAIVLVGSSGYAMKRAQATSHRGSLRLSDFTVLIWYRRVARRLGYISSDSGYPGTIVFSCLRSSVEYAEWGLPVAVKSDWIFLPVDRTITKLRLGTCFFFNKKPAVPAAACSVGAHANFNQRAPVKII